MIQLGHASRASSISEISTSKITSEMNANEKTILSLYEGFQQKNYLQMGACYADSATFQDPAFTLKNGKECRAMWHYLITNGKDLSVTFRDIKADEKTGTAHWEATYSFSATGRKVHNVIEASFEFENGKIVRHRDHFKFWKWTRMALGATGVFLGWTPLVKNKVRATAAAGLKKFMADKPEYQ
jgi:SnoaL-like domain